MLFRSHTHRDTRTHPHTRTHTHTPQKFLDTPTHTSEVPRHTHTHTHTHSLTLPNMLDPKCMCTLVKAVWPSLGEGSCVDCDIWRKPHWRNHERREGEGPSPQALRNTHYPVLRYTKQMRFGGTCLFLL